MDMTNSLLTSEDKPYFGTITSGGSESLMLALYAYRNFYSNRKKPNMYNISIISELFQSQHMRLSIKVAFISISKLGKPN
jgi:glutamate/tyrosine decarboxylase-like PLP-dependent enzyme